MTGSSPLSRPVNAAGPALFLAVVLVAGLHAVKAIGVEPSIFPDETIYNFGIRHDSFSNTPIPNFLFYILYQPIRWFGADFLDAARVLNGVLYAAAIPFIYLIARRACGFGLSLGIAVASGLMPSSLYVSYLSPESFYFFCFWFLSWVLVRYSSSDSPFLGAGTGTILGLTALVKAPALFLLPGLMIFLLLNARFNSSERIFKAGIRNALIAAASFFVAKFGIGYLVGGKGGLALLGTTYGGIGEGIFHFLDLQNLLSGILFNGFGHLIGLSFLFAVPLALVVAIVLDKPSADTGLKPVRLFSLLFFCFLLPMATVSVGFAAASDPVYPDISPRVGEGLHVRYYNFMFPWLLLVSGACITKKPALKREVFVPIAGVLLLLAAYGAFFDGLSPYALSNGLNFVEISMLRMTPWIVGRIIAVAAVVTGLIVLFNASLANKVFLYGFLPLYIMATLLGQANHIARLRSSPYHFIPLTREMKGFMGDETADLTIYDSSPQFASVVKWTFDHDDFKVVRAMEKGDIDPATLKPGSKWAITYGWPTIPDTLARLRLPFAENRFKPGYEGTLVRLAPYDFSFDLTGDRAVWPLLGARADDAGMTIEYALALPASVSMQLVLGEDDPAPAREYGIWIEGMSSPRKVEARKGGGPEFGIRARELGREIVLTPGVGAATEPFSWPAGIKVRDTTPRAGLLK